MGLILVLIQVDNTRKTFEALFDAGWMDEYYGDATPIKTC